MFIQVRLVGYRNSVRFSGKQLTTRETGALTENAARPRRPWRPGRPTELPHSALLRAPAPSRLACESVSCLVPLAGDQSSRSFELDTSLRSTHDDGVWTAYSNAESSQLTLTGRGPAAAGPVATRVRRRRLC